MTQVTLHKGNNAETYDFGKDFQGKSFFQELCDSYNIPDEDINRDGNEWRTAFIGHDVVITLTIIN
jgi:hypothetical protein